MSDHDQFYLRISCKNRPGIVAAVAGCIAQYGGDILDAAQFDDTETGQFMMRICFAARRVDDIEQELKSIADHFKMHTELVSAAHRPRVLIMVSKQDHCLHDLLYRWRKKGLNMDVVGVVSNHEVTRSLVDSYDLPFYYLPVAPGNKLLQEQELVRIIEARSVDLVILARYMQILSDKLSRELFGRVINIHHSFLPGFKGAKPYHQAHARGVKLIGATAHYVTPDLDEGPIIEQEVARIKHSDSVDDMIRLGQETEARVLARAVRWHLEHRVLLNGDKTVVFN